MTEYRNYFQEILSAVPDDEEVEPDPMTTCAFECGGHVPPERLELGYPYCIRCAEAQPELARPTMVVIGQHKGPPLVLAPHDPVIVGRESTMNRG